jgi:cytochrome c biogenesis protein CcmG, thiol:disulfide interchange protein DsbE
MLLALAVLLVLRFSRPVSEPEADNGESHSAVGTALTELSLTPLTGDPPPVELSNLDGKITLINFWGPWCGPCNLEFPHLMELVEHFRTHDDFQFLSVSVNPSPHDTAGLAESTSQFLRQKKANLGTYFDPGGKTQIALIQAARIEEFGYPATLLVDDKRVVRGLWLGYRAGDERQVRQAVQALLPRD